MSPERAVRRVDRQTSEAQAREAIGDEKHSALAGLLAKYSPDHVDEGLRYIDALRDETRVFRIDVASLSGKARRA